MEMTIVILRVEDLGGKAQGLRLQGLRDVLQGPT